MEKTIPPAAEKIKERILGAVDASRIYLFGSHARGTQTADSDYDFFVVLPNDSMRPMEAMQRIYLVLAAAPMPVPVDVLAACERDFERRKSLPCSIEQTIQKEGVLLYERP